MYYPPRFSRSSHQGRTAGPFLAPILLILVVLLSACGQPDTSPDTSPDGGNATTVPVQPIEPSPTAPPGDDVASEDTPVPSDDVQPTVTSAGATTEPVSALCDTAPDPTFGADASERLIEALGCPTGEAFSVSTGYLPFENGFMVWRGDTREIYAVYGDGSWQVVPDAWQEGDPDYTCNGDMEVPTSPPVPKRGFGRAWCEDTALQAKLGNSLTDEVAGTLAVQEFEQGIAMQAPMQEDLTILLNRSDFTWQ